MGLDMYLDARRSLSTWDIDKELHTQVNELVTSLGFNMEVKEITFRAVYWRKANAIHRWFVTNVQDGVDDCGTYEVPVEKLNELLIVIDDILEDNSKAATLLPTTDGFFFGDTAINEYYFDELRKTKEEIGKLLEISNIDTWDWSLYYHSSW
jgi:hypothetical protein